MKSLRVQTNRRVPRAWNRIALLASLLLALPRRRQAIAA